MSGVALVLSGRGVLIVGVERHANGAMRVYIGSRRDGRYFIPHPEDEERIARAWAGCYTSHLVMDKDDLEGVPIFTETP